MTKEEIARINALAAKSRTAQGLTSAEKAEQTELRSRYVAAMKASLRAQLDQTVILEENGGKTPLKKRP